MEKRVGLWIDHDEAVIVFLSDHGQETHRVTSRPPARLPGEASGEASAPTADATSGATKSPGRGRYYDEVVARLGDARAVLIFGIDEATREVAARLDGQGRSDRVIGVATAERMTAAEIATEVRGRFQV